MTHGGGREIPLDTSEMPCASPAHFGSPEWMRFRSEVLGPEKWGDYTPRRHASAWQWMVVHLRAMFGWRDSAGSIAPPLGRSFAWGPTPALLSEARRDPLRLPAEFRAFIVLSRALGCVVRPVVHRAEVEPPLPIITPPSSYAFSLGREHGVGWEILSPTDAGSVWAEKSRAEHASLNARLRAALLPEPGTPGAWALQTSPDAHLRLKPLLVWMLGEHARERLMAPLPGRKGSDGRRFPFNTLAAAEQRLVPSRVPVFAELDFEPPARFEVLPPFSRPNPNQFTEDSGGYPKQRGNHSRATGVKRTGCVCPAPWPKLRDDDAEPWPPEPSAPESLAPPDPGSPVA